MLQEVIQINKYVNPNKKRVCAYARVSSKSEEQENSLEAQIEAYTKLIMMNPEWEFAGVFVDDGITATSIYKRKDFQKMINKAMSGQIDMIITKSLSRFCRNAEDAINILRVLRNNNVEVYFESENISSFNTDSELLINVLSAHAQNESKVISDNVRMSYAKNFKDKKAYFNQELLYGYHKDKDGNIIIDKNEAEAVRLIYDLYLDDDGFKVQELYVHYFPAIYPDEDLAANDRANQMMKKNYNLWVKKYEEFYQKKLEY